MLETGEFSDLHEMGLGVWSLSPRVEHVNCLECLKSNFFPLSQTPSYYCGAGAGADSEGLGQAWGFSGPGGVQSVSGTRRKPERVKNSRNGAHR